MTFPKIVSADDHIVEPPTLWTDRLPKRFLEDGPRVVRELGRVALTDGDFAYERTDEGTPADVWYFEDVRAPSTLTGAAAGYELDDMELRVITFEDMRPGCFDPVARLADMDVAGIEGSACFPNLFVRFCGQRFMHARDKELALLCVRAYNDFVVDEWCAGSNGRLIPLGIVPLWDSALARQEVHRMADRGMHAFCFSELPTFLGLPSIHSGEWDPFFEACDSTSSAIMMHIGSSSKLPTTSADAPNAVQNTIPAVNSAMSLLDWLFSGVFVRYPTLRVGMAECQIGWIPYFLQRADEIWLQQRGREEASINIPEPPSDMHHVYCTFFDDPVGLESLHHIGVDNVMFETDYPHSDTNWPESLDTFRKMTEGLEASVVEKLARGNALRLFGVGAVS